MNRKIIITIVSCALMLSLCVPFGDAGVVAAAEPEGAFTLVFQSNGTWKDLDGNEKKLLESSKIGGAVTIGEAFDLWHSSVDYWASTDIRVDDTQCLPNYVTFDELMRGSKAQFELDLPAAVKEKISAGNKIIVAIRIGNGRDGVDYLDIDRLFYTDMGKVDVKFTPSADKLRMELPIRFNFMRQNPNDATSPIVTMTRISELIEAQTNNGNIITQDGDGLPVPEFGYGRLHGAIWGRAGKGYGSHLIRFYNGNEFLFTSPYDSPPPDPYSPWWLGHLRMNGIDAVLDPAFDDKIVHTYEGSDFYNRDIAVGYGTFQGLGAVGANFYYPLVIEYYLEETDNLGAAVRTQVSSERPGNAVNLSFLVMSSFEGNVPTNYKITRIWGTETAETGGLLSARAGETEVPGYSFLMPAEDVRVIFTVNPSGANPLETYMDDNTLELHITAAKPLTYTGAVTLDYNVLTQTETFYLGATTAALELPDYYYSAWDGPATGTLTVTNRTPELYRDFKVNGISGNRVVLDITSTDENITMNPLIQTTVVRDWDNYLDDALMGRYGAKDAQNTIRPPRTGLITVEGSVSRQYSYRSYVSSWSGGYYVTIQVTVTADFSDVTNSRTITVKVYNGKERLAPKTAPINQIDDNYDASLSKRIRWESEEIPLTVVRPMGDMNPGFAERIPPPVTGQFERIFTNQDEAAATWSIAAIPGGKPLDMQSEYKPDRDKSKSRNYNVSGAEKAVFASDISFNSVQHPIRSGYFFNPAGTYAFTITTDIYKDTPGKTEEHEQLVGAMIDSFRYESNMTYIDPSKQAVTIGGLDARKTGAAYAPAPGYATVSSSPLFDIAARRDFSLDNVEELRHNYTESGTDPRLMRVLEGYDESGTQDSKNNYKYIEYVHNDETIYKITETTTVTITVNPDNSRVYTHPQMKNGDYSVRAYFADVRLNSLSSLSYSGYLASETLYGVKELDRIDIKVVGSIYDDVR